ncbi:MAG: hypothetical protein K2X39_07670 [Silvanigrellaceae bacterium]|nr:hypothetical protein [Silvanigrellaceae bacterium]
MKFLSLVMCIIFPLSTFFSETEASSINNPPILKCLDCNFFYPVLLNAYQDVTPFFRGYEWIQIQYTGGGLSDSGTCTYVDSNQYLTVFCGGFCGTAQANINNLNQGLYLANTTTLLQVTPTGGCRTAIGTGPNAASLYVTKLCTPV